MEVAIRYRALFTTIEFKQLYRAYQLYDRKSEYLGDVAVLKADAFDASMTPELAGKMQPVVGYYPKIDLAWIIHQTRSIPRSS